MYINPTGKLVPDDPKSVKKANKSTNSETTFVEALDAAIGVDAVDTSDLNKEREKGGDQSSNKKREKEEESGNPAHSKSILDIKA